MEPGSLETSFVVRIPHFSWSQAEKHQEHSHFYETTKYVSLESNIFDRTIIEKTCEINKRKKLSSTSSFIPTVRRIMILYLLQLAVEVM